MKLVFGHDAAIADWTARHIAHVNRDFGPCSAIGVVDGNRPLAGVVYHDYQPEYGTMQVSIAAISPRWAQKGIIYALLSYPFDQIGIYKLWSAIPMKNERSLKFNLGIGFKQEGILAHHFGKDHAVISRMFRKDFEKRYKEIRVGKIEPLATIAS